MEKPNPVIFEVACELLGCRPVETVHVGDDRRRAARAPVWHLPQGLESRALGLRNVYLDCC